MIVKYKGQNLKYIEDFHGRQVLWITTPSQINMKGMTFVGGYPNEYCIFINELPKEDQDKIRKQIKKGSF